MGELKKVRIGDTENVISGGGGGGGAGLEEVTYADLLAARNGGTLTPGGQYRITDYVCTTVQEESRAVSHPFDIIVTADDESTLNENARACLHEGDNYYSAQGSSAVLEAWELKYCIDNDDDRFAWADTVNGKGVIYWMKDNHGNEAPYDFKQIQFKRYEITASTVSSLVGQYASISYGAGISGIDEDNPVWMYTFSEYDPDAQQMEIKDATVTAQEDGLGCVTYGNMIQAYRFLKDLDEYTGPYVCYLNDIVFVNTNYSYCYYNTFGENCDYNTFGESCFSNTFGGDFSSNTFGVNCSSNTFGDECDYNTFGDYCYYNTFEDGYDHNTFGDDCAYNTFGYSCEYIDFFASDMSGRYYHVLGGVKGTQNSHIAITGTAYNNYVTCVGKDSSGTLKTWVPADQAP